MVKICPDVCAITHISTWMDWYGCCQNISAPCPEATSQWWIRWIWQFWADQQSLTLTGPFLVAYVGRFSFLAAKKLRTAREGGKRQGEKGRKENGERKEGHLKRHKSLSQVEVICYISPGIFIWINTSHFPRHSRYFFIIAYCSNFSRFKTEFKKCVLKY